MSRAALFFAFAPFFLLFFLGQSDVQIISPILSEVRLSFAVTVAQAGSAVSVYSLVAALWALVVGPLSDHWGRRIFLQAAALVLALSAVSAWFADAFKVFLLSRLLAGIAGATISVCTVAWLADEIAFERRGRAMGVLGAVNVLAAVVVAPLAAFVSATHFGWRSIYLTISFAAVLSFVLALKKQVPEQKFSQAAAWHFSTALVQTLRRYAAFLTLSTPLRGMILALLISSSVTSVVTYLGIWLSSGLSFSNQQIAEAFLVLGLTSLAGAVAGGWLSDRAGKKFVIIMTGSLLSVVLFSARAVSGLQHALFFVAAGGLLFGMREGAYQALVTELVAPEQRGAYIALKSTAAKFGIAVSVALCGLMYGHWGFPAVAAYAALCSLLSAILAAGLVLFRPETGDSTQR